MKQIDNNDQLHDKKCFTAQVPAEHFTGELFRLSETTSTDQIRSKIHNV